MSEKSNTVVVVNSYVYPYGKSIMNCRVDNCPIEVFKNESSWYKSLVDSIDDSKEMIENYKKKLDLLNDEVVKQYVNEHFNEIYDDLEEKANKKLNEHKEIIKQYDLDESDDDELNEIEEYMNKLPEIVDERLRREYYKKNHVYPEQIEEMKDMIIQYENHLNATMQDLAEWKEYCLTKAKKEEQLRLQKYLSVPHSNEDVIMHLIDYSKERINANFTDLLDEYYEMYEQLFDEMMRDKYKRTIKNVFDTQSSTKVMKAFTNHNQLLMTRLVYIIERIKLNLTDEFVLIENALKKSFDKFITDHFMSIYQFLQKNISSIKRSEVEFDNSTALKNYARSVVSEINTLLIEGLPDALNQNFSEYIEGFMSKLNTKVKVGINNEEQVKKEVVVIEEEVKSIELTIDSFMKTVPDTEMDLKELVCMYNHYFGMNISTVGFSKLKNVKNLFTKRSVVKSGKKITYYTKA